MPSFNPLFHFDGDVVIGVNYATPGQARLRVLQSNQVLLEFEISHEAAQSLTVSTGHPGSESILESLVNASDPTTTI